MKELSERRLQVHTVMNLLHILVCDRSDHPAAALKVYQSLIAEGTQQNVVDIMQTRAELYDYLDYHSYEQKLDALFSEENE